MEQIIVTGVNASGLLVPQAGQGFHIKSIEIDVPLNEVGTTDPIVTISGSATGAFSFHSDTTLEQRFTYGEDVYITTAAFTAEYSAVIRYLAYGDSSCARQIASPWHKIPVPWRFRT